MHRVVSWLMHFDLRAKKKKERKKSIHPPIQGSESSSTTEMAKIVSTGTHKNSHDVQKVLNPAPKV
jgi:hypothetical protein